MEHKWRAEEFETYAENSKSRGWLVVRGIRGSTTKSSDRLRIHRASTGAPIWYTKAGAEKAAKRLNEEGSKW